MEAIVKVLSKTGSLSLIRYDYRGKRKFSEIINISIKVLKVAL